MAKARLKVLITNNRVIIKEKPFSIMCEEELGEPTVRKAIYSSETKESYRTSRKKWTSVVKPIKGLVPEENIEPPSFQNQVLKNLDLKYVYPYWKFVTTCMWEISIAQMYTWTGLYDNQIYYGDLSISSSILDKAWDVIDPDLNSGRKSTMPLVHVAVATVLSTATKQDYITGRFMVPLPRTYPNVILRKGFISTEKGYQQQDEVCCLVSCSTNSQCCYCNKPLAIWSGFFCNYDPRISSVKHQDLTTLLNFMCSFCLLNKMYRVIMKLANNRIRKRDRTPYREAVFYFVLIPYRGLF